MEDLRWPRSQEWRTRDRVSKATMAILARLAEDESVATHREMITTQAGEFRGLAATNKEATRSGVSIDPFENAKIVERLGCLGEVPIPPPTPFDPVGGVTCAKRNTPCG